MGLNVEVSTPVPFGSGLGGSSSLLIAVMAAVARWIGRPYGRRRLVDEAADLEVQLIGKPTGKQDHIAAAFGGVSAIDFRVGGWRRQSLNPGVSRWLSRHLLVAFTGASHFSATENWKMYRRALEEKGKGDAIRGLEVIRQAAHDCWEGLARRDLGRVADAVAREWRARRGLAPGITTPRVELLMREARRGGALACKLCGAGGGGTMIVLAPAERIAPMGKALGVLGARVLSCRPDRRGLCVDSDDNGYFSSCASYPELSVDEEEIKTLYPDIDPC
jgi:D-glycero-alpha-D-manno-heptose-7-phosphate kinase